MAKNDQSTQGAPSAPGTLDANAQALVQALTAAIVSTRQSGPPPHPEAGSAAFEYTVIKSALRTHAEGLHGSGAQYSRRNRKG
jgi:hypothetical protein